MSDNPYRFMLLITFVSVVGAIAIGQTRISSGEDMLALMETSALDKGYTIDQCARERVFNDCVLNLRGRYEEEELSPLQIQHCERTALQMSTRTDSTSINSPSECLLKDRVK